MKKRSIIIAAVVAVLFLLAAVASVAAWWWLRPPDTNFLVEQYEGRNASPQFTSGGLSAGEVLEIAQAVRRRTRSPVRCVIVTDAIPGAAYAFVGNSSGIVYEFWWNKGKWVTGPGLPWSGDPREYVRQHAG